MLAWYAGMLIYLIFAVISIVVPIVDDTRDQATLTRIRQPALIPPASGAYPVPEYCVRHHTTPVATTPL